MMRTHTLVVAWLTGVVLASGTAAQEHAAAPMIGSPPPPVSKPGYAAEIASIKTTFRQNYQMAGRPRLAIFWNRNLDDQLSQWYTQSRNIDTREHLYGEGFSATQRRLDVEGRFDDRPDTGELASFEFGAGFTRTLLNAGVEIVDRDTIMRLTHRDVEAIAENIIVADYQQVEIDALVDYADYLAEVIYSPESDDDAPFSVMITIKEVRTGRMVSMFRSRNTSLPQPSLKYEWVATESGYARQAVASEDVNSSLYADGISPGTPEQLGWNVAIQTMNELSQYLVRQR
tara:strand:+ start:5519 stop:6379 length:861 start_codon:yes stop_codon:yes gene_type:complete